MLDLIPAVAFFKTSSRPPIFTCTWAPSSLSAQLEDNDSDNVYVDDSRDPFKALSNPGRTWPGEVQVETLDGQWALVQLRTWQCSMHTPNSRGLDANDAWTGKRRTVMTLRPSDEYIRRFHEQQRRRREHRHCRAPLRDHYPTVARHQMQKAGVCERDWIPDDMHEWYTDADVAEDPTQAYPVGDHRRPCPGCRRNRRADHPEHIRRDGCRVPNVEPVVWECLACARNLPAAHLDHTHVDGQCRVGEQ
ncbi:hypothetical protein N9L68_03325 [bacterium]|nr:hypothetical protein [bacterium]